MDDEDGAAQTVVSIQASIAGVEQIEAGTEVILTADVSGHAPDLYTVQWQYSNDNGQTVFDAEDGNALEYRYVITEENKDYIWRVKITFLPEE